MKIVKMLNGDFTGIRYKIVDHSELNTELPFTLYYYCEGRWCFCGDHYDVGDAEKYMKSRESFIANGDTVML